MHAEGHRVELGRHPVPPVGEQPAAEQRDVALRVADLEPDQLRKQLDAANRRQAGYADQLRLAQTDRTVLAGQRQRRHKLQAEVLDVDGQHKLAHDLAELRGHPLRRADRPDHGNAEW